MKNRLTSHFCFYIPEAIIKTSLKKLPEAILANGIYAIKKNKVYSDSLFKQKKAESDENASYIIQQLSKYISDRTGNDNITTETLSQELTNFLVEDASSQSSEYSDLIGEFVLKNENNTEIQESLNKIREGSILYLGLSHSIREIGSIKHPIHLYLGTEILFSLVGYNGKIFQQFADDFFAQVRTANSGKKQKIFLHYFSDIRKEIDEFFDIAIAIVERKRQYFIDKPAMKAIINGCTNETDVKIKKADFYYTIKQHFGIKEDTKTNYYSKQYFTSNLEGIDFDDENDKRKEEEDDKSKKKDMALKLISNINKLRNNRYLQNDLNSEHIIVTNAKTTLLISKKLSDKIKETKDLGSVYNFAISLDRITCLLWYKLGNGFAKEKDLSSLKAILKARTVLSASIAKKAEEEFYKVKKEYTEGLINSNQVVARIVELKKKAVLPEDLQGDEIDEMMDFTPEYLTRYEEQVKNDKQALKDKENLIKAMNAEKAEFERKFRENEEQRLKQEKELKEYRQRDEAVLQKKLYYRNLLKFICSITLQYGMIAGFVLLAIYLNIEYKSKIIEYISIFASVVTLPYLFMSIYKKAKKKYLKKSDGE